MDKKRYYVSVQAGTILAGQGDAAYEFEIDATEEDVERLQRQFVQLADRSEATMFRAHALTIPYHHDAENHAYDDNLVDIYRMLHELGTVETKRHIEKMGVLTASR
ncbi:MAG: hypothetical protein K0R75_1500 [Paenibacillaceae bacterium]|nr:hypothetical protein [Paenibacillaceae bacterium]